MTDLDLERLGNVWRQRPDPEELEELKRSAERVRRRAQWLQVVDVAAAIVVAGVVLFLILSNPAPDTLIVGGGAIVVLLVSQIRSRRYRQRELRSLTGSVEEMLDQTISRVQAALKRARSTLIIMPPGFLLGILLGFVIERRSGGVIQESIAAQPGLGPVIQIGFGLAIAAAFILTIRSIRSNRRELERLNALRDSYRLEQDSSSAE